MGRAAAYVRQNHLAIVALVVALVGVPTAFAIGKNTVGPKQIKKNAVRKAEIATGAVQSPEVSDGSLTADDFAADALTPGPQGERGPEGPQGPAGQDATNLFASINDNGTAQGSQVAYGEGVTGVTEFNNSTDEGSYTVQFNRSLVGCAVQVTPGLGQPLAGGSFISRPVSAEVGGGDSDFAAGRVGVATWNSNTGGSPPAFEDSSFFIAAFC